MTTWDKSPQLEAQVQASMGIVCELGMVGPFPYTENEIVKVN